MKPSEGIDLFRDPVAPAPKGKAVKNRIGQRTVRSLLANITRMMADPAFSAEQRLTLLGHAMQLRKDITRQSA